MASGLRAQTPPAPTAICGYPVFGEPKRLPPLVSGSFRVRVTLSDPGSTREMLTVVVK